jgi:hypothetical protein
VRQATTLCDFCAGDIPQNTPHATFTLPIAPGDMRGQPRMVTVGNGPWGYWMYDGQSERTLDVCVACAVGILEIARDAQKRIKGGVTR